MLFLKKSQIYSIQFYPEYTLIQVNITDNILRRCLHVVFIQIAFLICFVYNELTILSVVD